MGSLHTFIDSIRRCMVTGRANLGNAKFLQEKTKTDGFQL